PHSPPFGTDLDVLSSGEHVGSRAVRDFITRWAREGMLQASFHGHIHESPDVSGSICTVIEGVQCFNPGQNGGPTATLKYLLFEIEGTTVSANPAVLYADTN
ncbi:MAG: hypothetical protein JJE30_10435, partial [Desulfuromonadales bacterium]|nr:hypothetical protein [Desulfuromonadales bacterium]